MKSYAKILTAVLLAGSLTGVSTGAKGAGSSKAFIVATNYVKADGKTDVAAKLQKLIDDNPNRTIYFPDGVYLVSRSILTPADPRKSVHLVMSNYATLKATETWGGGAVLRLGGEHPYNSITINGSNYGIEGGIVDGSGVADGISIDSGRETKIKNTSIKHTRVGIHIKRGANSGSSDADVCDVNIVGNDKPDAIGVLVEGYDNTFTNMRIGHINKGFVLKSAGNSLRNIHPLYTNAGNDSVFNQSVGFVVEQGNNWFSFCYSDQLATGYKLSKGVAAIFTDCFCLWWNGKVDFQTVFEQDGPFESTVVNQKIGFNGSGNSKYNVIKAEKWGHGKMINPFLPNMKLSDEDVTLYYKR